VPFSLVADVRSESVRSLNKTGTETDTTLTALRSQEANALSVFTLTLLLVYWRNGL
jgi:hypothetical protein